jgi:Icc-related predicted phosphoesterase
MKILFFSDWRIHDFRHIEEILNEIQDIDLILYGGDDVKRFYIDERGGNKFIEFGQKAKYGLGAVIGNDCTPSSASIIEVDGSVFNLHKTPLKIGEYSIVGIEGGIYREEEEGIINGIGYTIHDDSTIVQHLNEMVQTYDINPEKMIIVSHTPPYEVLDIGIRFGVENIGSKGLKTYILEHNPLMVLSGHVHSQGGKTDKVNNTLIVNAASDDQNYDKCHVALIHINESVDVKWLNVFKNDIRSISGIGGKRSSQLISLDVRTRQDFLELHDEVIKNLNIGISKRKLLQIRAEEQALKEDCYIRFNFEPFKNEQEYIVYDVETDLSQNVWMIAAIGPDGQVFQDYELDREKKKRKVMYSRFIEFINTYKGVSMCSWSGCGFDNNAITRGLGEYCEKKLGQWSIFDQFDPITDYRRRFVLNQNTMNVSWSLKHISNLLGFNKYNEFEVDDISGFEVGVAYEAYKRNRKPFDVERIAIYNLLDCEALVRVVDALEDDFKQHQYQFFKPFDETYLKSKGPVIFPNEKVKEEYLARLKEKEDIKIMAKRRRALVRQEKKALHSTKVSN